MNELISLRVSIARLAQSACVDNHLGVTNKVYEELVELAHQPKGWHGLLLEIAAALADLQQADRRRAYHYGEAHATVEGYEGSYDNPVLP